jgi:hypothetical protein
MLQGQHLTMYQFIQDNPYCTRDDVARGTGTKSSTATARIKELIDEGLVIEPAGMRKPNKSGVKAKCLHISTRKQGGKPLDRVRIDVKLTIDANGYYHAEASVVDGMPLEGRTHVIKTQRITMTAPHPDTYRSVFEESDVATISRHEIANMGDVIDADFIELDNQ